MTATKQKESTLFLQTYLRNLNNTVNTTPLTEATPKRVRLCYAHNAVQLEQNSFAHPTE